MPRKPISNPILDIAGEYNPMNLVNPFAYGGAPTSWADDFNRANSSSLGGNWTSQSEQWSIVSNRADGTVGGSYPTNISTYNSPANTLTTYQRITLSDTQGVYAMGFVFRFTNASSPFYQIDFHGFFQTVRWIRIGSIGGSSTEIVTSSISVNSGDTFGVIVTGTGNDTIVRVWRNPANNTPFSSSRWDDSSDTPDVEFTNDPASPVDSGSLGGLIGAGNTTLAVDNWFYGDIA